MRLFMAYQGYSIVGDTEFLKEKVEINTQKEKLKNQVRNDLAFIKQQLITYLEHSYTLHYVKEENIDIIRRLIDYFDGEARNALYRRGLDNLEKLDILNNDYQQIINTTETFFDRR